MADEVEAIVQTLIKVPAKEAGKFGLAPFSVSNPPPHVSNMLSFYLQLTHSSMKQTSDILL
jgi:hypothetical protein